MMIRRLFPFVAPILVVCAFRLLNPPIVVDVVQRHVLGTFKTQTLIVEQNSFVGSNSFTSTMTLQTSPGQVAAFTTNRAASTDGFNLFVGGGGTVVAYDGVHSSSGSSNTSFGIQSMLGVTTGNGNTAMGHESMILTTVGQLNAAYGTNSLAFNTTGSYNTAIGNSAMTAMVDDVDNSCVGQACMLNISHGDGNVALGVQSLEGGAPSQTITHSVAIGLNAAQTLLTGAGQITAVGYQALGAITTAVAPTALGAFALQACNTCTGSTGLGASAGPNLTSGQYNTLIGGLAGGGITTGSGNTVIGANISGLSAALTNTVILGDGAGHQRFVIDSSGNASLPGVLDMASHKITSLTNGSSAQDAAAFGQIASAVSGAVVGTANTVAKFTGTNAVGNASFTDNGTTVTFSTNVALGTHTLTGVTDLTTTGNTTLGDASTDTLTVNATTTHAAPTTTAGTSTTAITPAAITGTTNNWNPTGIGTADVIYIATSGTTTITGLVAAQCTNGRTITLVNISANQVNLPHASGTSTRPFHNTGGFTWILYPANDWGHTNEVSTITYRCSTTSNSWEQVGLSNLAVPAWEIDGQLIINGTSTIIGGPGNPMTFTNSNHLLTNGGAGGFGLTCNGTGAAATCGVGACTDLAGTITTNTNATTCTVTFGGTYTTSPSCVVSTGTSVATPAYISARSGTAITITFPSMSAGTIDYHCIGH